MQITSSIARKVEKALVQSKWKSIDPTLRALLNNTDVDEKRQSVRIGLWAAVGCYILYGAFDAILFPDVAVRLIAVRTGVGAIFILLMEIGYRRRFSLSALNTIAAAAIVAGSTGWLYAASGTVYHAELSAFMVFGAVFVLGANLFFSFRLTLSAAASAIVTIAFAAMALTSLRTGLADRLVLAAFIVNCLVFSLYLSWRLRSERNRAFLHSMEALIQQQAAVKKGEMLDSIANTDPLTGLRNRRAIANDYLRIRDEAASAGKRIGVILVDVDYFKRYNDRLGHQAGDDCLVKLGNALASAAAQDGAVAGRYGGEEFVVVCTVEDTEELSGIADRLSRAVEFLRIPHPNTGLASGIVTISAGAAMAPAGSSATFVTLIQQADRALYASKFVGRATFRLYDATTMDEGRFSLDIPELLRQAVVSDLVSVVYQPLLESATGKVLGHETLMRLSNFNGDPVSPAAFIPVAEHTGAITEIGMWVIDRACRDMAAGGLGSVVSANVSPVQLKAPNFPLRIAEILSKHSIPAYRLALEITESIDIVPEAEAERNIELLRTLGVQVWLDDFGTGYAGLAAIRRFKFDLVKVDRTFLHDCHTPEGKRMLEDIVNLLRNLGCKVLVEGVETHGQKELLLQLGVDSMQGFLLGRPSPISSWLPTGAPRATTLALQR